VRASSDITARLTVGTEMLSVRVDELDRLVDALARLDLREAESIGEQITALRLLGGAIHLTPTEAELAAIQLALAVLAEQTQPLSLAFLRLAHLCAGDDELAGQAR